MTAQACKTDHDVGFDTRCHPLRRSTTPKKLPVWRISSALIAWSKCYIPCRLFLIAIVCRLDLLHSGCYVAYLGHGVLFISLPLPKDSYRATHENDHVLLSLIFHCRRQNGKERKSQSEIFWAVLAVRNGNTFKFLFFFFPNNFRGCRLDLVNYTVLAIVILCGRNL